MKPSQLSQFLSRAIEARLPILIVGAPGVGKSDLVGQAAEAAGADLIISHPAVSDPTDTKGLPWPDGSGGATFLPFGELARALRAERPTVWFLDDLGQAPPAVQAGFMQLLLARRVNGHVLPDVVTFIAATNRRTDRAGVSGILEPVKSRFAAIVELEPDLDDWCSWAFAHDIPDILVAFLRFRPELLCAFDPTMDLRNSPVPRTWAHVAKILALGLPSDIERQAIAGAVGEGAAVEFAAFRTVVESLPSIDGILIDPDAGEIPSKPAALYAVATGLGARASVTAFGRIARYAARLEAAGLGEFATLLLRDCVRREPKLLNTGDFLRLAAGPLGQLINGKGGAQ